MDEGTISLNGLVTWVLWAWVFCFMVAAWVVMLVDPHAWRIAGMLAATSCVSSALAAVMHIRCFHLSTRRLLVERLDLEPEGARVRHLR